MDICLPTACPVLLSTDCVLFAGEPIAGINKNDSLTIIIQKLTEIVSTTLVLKGTSLERRALTVFPESGVPYFDTTLNLPLYYANALWYNSAGGHML